MISDNAFDDLLGSQGFSSSSSSSFSAQPKTIKEMRKEIDKKVMDPDKLKVGAVVWDHLKELMWTIFISSIFLYFFRGFYKNICYK